MMDNWRNVEDNHMMPDGEMKSCATTCLKGGQPAALFSGGQITAVFSCSPQATLSNYAAGRSKFRVIGRVPEPTSSPSSRKPMHNPGYGSLARRRQEVSRRGRPGASRIATTRRIDPVAIS